MERRSEGSPEKVRAAARWEKTKAKACRQLFDSVPLLSLADCRNTMWEGLLLLGNQTLLLRGEVAVFVVVLLMMAVASRRGRADDRLIEARRAHVGSFAKQNTKMAINVLLAVILF